MDNVENALQWVKDLPPGTTSGADVFLCLQLRKLTDAHLRASTTVVHFVKYECVDFLGRPSELQKKLLTRAEKSNVDVTDWLESMERSRSILVSSVVRAKMMGMINAYYQEMCHMLIKSHRTLSKLETKAENEAIMRGEITTKTKDTLEKLKTTHEIMTDCVHDKCNLYQNHTQNLAFATREFLNFKKYCKNLNFTFSKLSAIEV